MFVEQRMPLHMFLTVPHGVTLGTETLAVEGKDLERPVDIVTNFRLTPVRSYVADRTRIRVIEDGKFKFVFVRVVFVEPLSFVYIGVLLCVFFCPC
jgi:hypothetical protein